MTRPCPAKAKRANTTTRTASTDYVTELAGDDALTPVHFCQGQAAGRDRADQPEYKVQMSAAFCFSNKVQLLEYYHNSSWLEHGGSPDRAVRPPLSTRSTHA